MLIRRSGGHTRHRGSEDLGGGPAPDFNYPGAHGFTYQAEAIHRCLAAGLLQCPQFTAAESLTSMAILDGIEAALHSQPALPHSPRPQFAGQLPAVHGSRTPAAVAGVTPGTPYQHASLGILYGLVR